MVSRMMVSMPSRRVGTSPLGAGWAGGRRKVLWLDPAGGEEGVKIGGVEADVPAQLEVGDSALGHESADEPRRHAQAFGCFWDTHGSLHAGPPVVRIG